MTTQDPVLVIGPQGELSSKLLALCQSTGHDAWHYDCFPAQKWKNAPSILICADAEISIQQKRAGVALVASKDLTLELYQQAIELGAEEIHSLENATNEIADFLNREHFTATECKVILIHGTSGSAGSTSLALSLAQQYQKQNKKCLLVDTHQYHKGLSAFIEEDGVDWSDFLSVQGTFSLHHFQSLPKISQVPCLTWTRADSLQFLLEPRVFASVLETAQSAFDVVVIDGSAENLTEIPEATLVIMMRATANEAIIAQQLRKQVTEMLCIVQGKIPTGVDEKLIKETVALEELFYIKHQKHCEGLSIAEPEKFLKALAKSEYPKFAQHFIEKL
ncbi:MAG: hypothetical protein QM632_06470 [Micrococcaceae bacterium]